MANLRRWDKSHGFGRFQPTGSEKDGCFTVWVAVTGGRFPFEGERIQYESKTGLNRAVRPNVGEAAIGQTWSGCGQGLRLTS